MELYDKKYVYFEWEDKLEGKKVILAHTIKNIKEFVANGDKGRFFIAQKGNDLPFTNGMCECEFAYYDPNYEVKKAYNEGKKLQYKYKGTKWNDWVLETETEPSNKSFEECEWRIKPEEKPHYVICSNSKFYISDEDKDEFDSIYYKGSESECINFIISHQDFEPIAVAFQNGKTVQAYENGEWCDYNINCSVIPGNFDSLKWRIKPETVKEEPKKDRYLTNKELAMWLAQGKGQVQDRRTGRISTNHYYFEYDDSQVDYINIGIRKWEDDKWHEPEYSYCFGGNK